MSLLDEQLIEEWLNRKGFFTVRGLKTGLGEIDLLAIRHNQGSTEAWHLEAQISFRPIGYIGGGPSAKRRSEEEVLEGVKSWVEKKFTSEAKISKRNSILPDAEWKYFLVHANVRHQPELALIRSQGVELLPYRKILDDLVADEQTLSSSVATNITDLIKFYSHS